MINDFLIDVGHYTAPEKSLLHAKHTRVEAAAQTTALTRDRGGPAQTIR